jgi:hypothetical protein
MIANVVATSLCVWTTAPASLGSIVMGELRILSAGVDTLHCSVRGELQDGLLVFLEALKEESQRTKELQVVTWGSRPYR